MTVHHDRDERYWKLLGFLNGNEIISISLIYGDLFHLLERLEIRRTFKKGDSLLFSIAT